MAVTKYFNASETKEILDQLVKEPCFLGVGENRIQTVLEKQIPRQFVHFIGNLQSRTLPDIAQHCSSIHSLCSLKHATILSKEKNIPNLYLQVNVSGEASKQGILPKDFPQFWEELQKLSKIAPHIKGLSGMGLYVKDGKQKQQEMQILMNIKEQYFPQATLSAGTSIDYKIALEEGIDIVRIGRKLFEMK